MATIYSHPRTWRKKPIGNWNLAEIYPIGMCISVHYTLFETRVVMFKPLPLNPPLPLLRWSNDQPQSRHLHGCHGHEATTGHGCRNILQKKIDTSFFHDKTMSYVYSRTCHWKQNWKNAHNFVHMGTSIVPLDYSHYLFVFNQYII